MYPIDRIWGMLPERLLHNYLFLSIMLEVTVKSNGLEKDVLLCHCSSPPVQCETRESELPFTDVPGREKHEWEEGTLFCFYL